MRDPHRGLTSAATEVPFGITLTVDGGVRTVDFSRLPITPLRHQLRDATLSTFIDRGGGVKSPASAKAYLAAASLLFERLSGSPVDDLDAAQLDVPTVHGALFRDLVAPIPVSVVLARRLLRHAAAGCGNPDEHRVLTNLDQMINQLEHHNDDDRAAGETRRCELTTPVT